jgi:hypothetical protein
VLSNVEVLNEQALFANVCQRNVADLFDMNGTATLSFF